MTFGRICSIIVLFLFYFLLHVLACILTCLSLNENWLTDWLINQAVFLLECRQIQSHRETQLNILSIPWLLPAWAITERAENNSKRHSNKTLLTAIRCSRASRCLTMSTSAEELSNCDRSLRISSICSASWLVCFSDSSLAFASSASCVIHHHRL